MPPSVGRRLAVPLVETFEREWPKARLAIVEGLSAHIAEWIVTGRVDVGLVHNPEPQPGLETEPVGDERIYLVSAGGRARNAVTLQELAKFPLVIPERTHAVRRLVEAQAALAGVKLDIAWEVSSVPAILALVRSGHGHAVLTHDAIADDEGGGRLVARPVGEPPLSQTLCIATSAARPASPLQRHVVRRLRELARRR
jgi:LysR family nitrogen assimilation transcriptional regulator